MFIVPRKITSTKSSDLVRSITNSSNKFFFKRHISYEQKLINVVNSGNIRDLNYETYSLVFDPSIVNKGALTNLVDRTIQSLPNNAYLFRKAFNVESFFKSNPHLNISLNPNQFSSIQYLNQRTNTICEVVAAETMKRKFNESTILTNGNIADKKLAFSQTGQNSCDYISAKVLYNGKVYQYYADLKITEKAIFLKRIASLHPQKLAFCQYHFVGGLTEEFIFDTATKSKLILGCQHFMSQHIVNNTDLAPYYNQLNKDLKIFDVDPTVANYNSLVVAPWRILTVPAIVSHLNA